MVFFLKYQELPHGFHKVRYVLRIRQLVDHGVKFSTTPQAAMGLIPGEYIRLYSESTHTSRFSNGSIDSFGTIQSQEPISNLVSGTTQIYYWRGGTTDVQGPVPIVHTDGIASSQFRNAVFTVAQENISDRVYKVESITYGEEGFIDVAASFVPLTDAGHLAILDGVNNPNSKDFIESYQH